MKLFRKHASSEILVLMIKTYLLLYKTSEWMYIVMWSLVLSWSLCTAQSWCTGREAVWFGG